jgi:hypothetical protein
VTEPPETVSRAAARIDAEGVAAILTGAGFDRSRPLPAQAESAGFLVRESFYEPGSLHVDCLPRHGQAGFDPFRYVDMLAAYAAALETAGCRALLLENGTYLVVTGRETATGGS